MAIKATIFKADIQLADMDRNYYQHLQLTIARHPSENDARMMIRLLAFCLESVEGLQFCRGISTDDEPDIWLKSLSDEIELWIELGQPDEKRIRKACNRARQVVIYSYGGNASKTWWAQTVNKLSRFSNLKVVELDKEATDAMAKLVQRSMRLQCSVQDQQVWLGDGEESVLIEPRVLMA